MSWIQFKLVKYFENKSMNNKIIKILITDYNKYIPD